MAMIEDLLPPDVREALADLALGRHLAGTDQVSANPPEHVEDGADEQGREPQERHRARTPQNHHPRHHPVEPGRRKLRAGVKVICDEACP
jgi:hypothetical protein